MRLEDAPPPGWYPDPEGSGRLRWWEGTDWTDDRRAPRSAWETATPLQPEAQPASADRNLDRNVDARVRSADTDRIVSQVRQAAREEVDRAATVFSQRAASALRAGGTVIRDYVDLVLRVVRIVVVVAASLVIVWFVFQFVAQATFLEWLGDRIDGLSSN